MTLYEIDQAILDLVDPETGEISDFEKLTELEMARDQKIENVGKWVKNLLSDIGDLVSEEKALKKRRLDKERKLESLKKYLADALQGQAFECAAVAIGWRKSSSLEITDPEACREYLESSGFDDCIKYAEPELRKEEIAKKINAGMKIPGCSIVTKNNMGVK